MVTLQFMSEMRGFHNSLHRKNPQW